MRAGGPALQISRWLLIDVKETLATRMDAPNFPLTHRQTLVWTEQMLAPDVPSNNDFVCFEIIGDVDPDRFGQAFDAVVAETDTLRSVFRYRGDDPRQTFLAELEETSEFLDLSGEVDPRSAFVAWRDKRCVTRFDLGERLFDCVLVRLSDRLSIWYLCQHGLIADAESFRLIFERSSLRYADLESNPCVCPPFVQYVDDEDAYRQSPDWSDSEQFWQERLAMPVEPIRPYGMNGFGRTFARHRRIVDFGTVRSERIRGLAATGDWTVSSPVPPLAPLFLTVLYAFLHRVTGNEVLGIGSPFGSRASRFAQSTGLFDEICPYRVAVTPTDSFVELHEKTSEELATVAPHARYSLGNPMNNRRFDVKLVFHDTSSLEFSGMSVATEFSNAMLAYTGAEPAMQIRPTGDQLTVSIHDAGDSIKVCLDFANDVFSTELSAVAQSHFERLIDACLEDPATPIGKVDLLSGGKPSAGRLANPTCSSRHTSAPLEQIRSQIAGKADQVAVVDGAGKLTYRQLGERIEALTAMLQGAGVRPDDRVGVCLPRSSDLLVALLATWSAGATYVPIDPSHPARRNSVILTDADPVAVICRPAACDWMNTDTERVILDRGWMDAGQPERPVEAPLAELAYVIFTSGSTGRPKGVEIPHDSLANLLAAMLETPGFSGTDHLLAITTVSFDIAALELFLPLVAGASLEIADDDSYRNPILLRERLSRDDVTVMQATPAMWQLLIDCGWRGNQRLKVLCGGERLTRELADALLDRSAEVWNLYGPTETTIWSTCAQIARGDEVTIGDPIDQTWLKVLDTAMNEVPPGTPGELYIGGAGLARGYFNNSQLTAERFVSDPGNPAGRLYRTGDVVRLRPEGGIVWLGRTDFQVKIRGFRIELGEIETQLRRHDDVADAVVMAQSERDDQILVAYVVPAQGSEPALAELSAHLRLRLPSYMIPSRWGVVNDLPLTPNGKLDRAALARLPAASGEPSEPPRNDVELQIASIWRHYLGTEQPSRSDDFFALGGTSLLAVKFLYQLESEFGVQLPFGRFFEEPTVAGVAVRLGDGSASAAIDAAVLLKPGTPDVPPLFCVGGVHLYQALARELDDDLPVYGVYLHEEQSWLASGGKQPDLDTSEVASRYIDVIRQQQPRGPYRLGGLSYGGVIAYEIARQLAAGGESVDALVLLDVRLHQTIARANGWYQHARHALRMTWRSWSRRWWGLEAQIDQLLERAIDRFERNANPYAGSALVCRALQHDRRPEDDPALGWASLIDGELVVADCPGDHLGIISTEHAAFVAAEITRYLRES